MKKSIYLTLLFGSIFLTANSQTDPVITSWKINTTGKMIQGILTDVESVYYDNDYVYVSASGVPDYYDFNNGNVNDASDQNWVFKLTRNPQENTGTPTSTLGGGQYGAFIDGTVFFNPEDARSYQNQNVWHQIAYIFEGMDFDNSLGHSTPNNTYHHHVVSFALIDLDSTAHSPLIGFAFDGFPVYGPFGYSDPNDANSAIARMTPGYQKRNITQRTTLPDGSNASQVGPAVSSQYPLGSYREDYEYVANSGTLDEHNGRFCKTPEYPNGIYAYFATLDANNDPVYPYIVGQSLYGVITPGNTPPMGGHNTIPGDATEYTPTSTGITSIANTNIKLYPNPVTKMLVLANEANEKYMVTIYDMDGRLVENSNLDKTTKTVDVSQLNKGVYLLSLTNEVTGDHYVGKIIRQ